VLWDAEQGRTERYALPGCHQPESLSLFDNRVAFDCPSGHAATFGRSIRVFPTRGRRPAEVVAGIIGDGLPPARLPGRVAGGSGLVAFSTYRAGGVWPVRPEPRLWVERRGRKAVVARGEDAGEPAAVDAGRIVVEREDGRVVVLRSDGRVLGRIAPGAPARVGFRLGFRFLERPTAALSGRDLVVLRQGRLLVYDARSFRLRRSWRVDRHARLGGVSDGLVAYVVATTIHVVRLRDGRSATIRTKSASGVPAAITSAGLFYALHARRVPQVQLAPFRRNPATVVFLRRAAILRQLR
jgi:hypothetical protein